jgi:pimeloyl-ACP methyl ester carboxylesterase
VAGCVLTSIGTGIGLPHLAKEGLGLWSGVGLVALVLGVAMLGLGLVGLARSVAGWWRLLAVPVVALVAVVVVYVLTVPLAVTVVPHSDLGSRTPASVGLDYREVTLPSDDGVELSAWYVPSGSGAAVVLLHGAGSTKSSVLDHASVLARHGYGVLLLDARGHGDSTGRAMDWGWYGDADVDAAVTFLAGADGVDPDRIAAVGMSMGGEEAVGALGTDPRLRAVVAEGVTGRSAADLQWLSEAYGWRGRLTEAVQASQTAVADLLTAADAPTTLRAAAAEAGARPMLLVGAGNKPDEQRAAADIRSASPDNVQVWVVPGSGHTGGLRTSPEAWEARVVGFLDAATS